MHAHRIANRRKCRRMKLLCILSGCPAGARKGLISIFAVLLHSKKQNDPEGSFSVSFQLLMRTTQRTVAPPTLAVTLAVPALTGLSLPSALTVTTEVSSLDHVTAASVPRRMS